MSDPATDLAIAERYPKEWARANDASLPSRSKARNNLRKRYRNAVEHDAFVRANPTAKCANCSNATRDPSVGLVGLSCDLYSDCYGFAMVDDEEVCARWEPAP